MSATKKPQLERFKEAAHDSGADMSKEDFARAIGKITKGAPIGIEEPTRTPTTWPRQPDWSDSQFSMMCRGRTSARTPPIRKPKTSFGRMLAKRLPVRSAEAQGKAPTL